MRLRGNAFAAAGVAEGAFAGSAALGRLDTGHMPGGRPAAVAGWRTASRRAAGADSRYARTARDIPAVRSSPGLRPCGGGGGEYLGWFVMSQRALSYQFGTTPTPLQRSSVTPRCPDGLRIHLENVRHIPIFSADPVPLLTHCRRWPPVVRPRRAVSRDKPSGQQHVDRGPRRLAAAARCPPREAPRRVSARPA